MTRVKPILKISRNSDAHEMQASLSTAEAQPVPRTLDDMAAVARTADSPRATATTYSVGGRYDVPLHDIDENEFGARVFYSPTEVEAMGHSIRANGQDVAAKGFVREGRVVLTDGQKRLRGSRVLGLRTLRVEVEPSPPSALANYQASRRINMERSEQTPLDDAAQWQKLLEKAEVSHPAELARQLGISESKVSQTLSFNRIPLRVRQLMIQRPNTCGHKIAYEIASLFSKDAPTDLADFEHLVMELVSEIGERELSLSQARTLIASRTSPPRTRARGEALAFHYGGVKGQLKTFPTTGKLELSIDGLAEDKLQKLRDSLQSLLKA